MKKVLTSLFIIIAFCICGTVKAESINSINMDVYVDKNGDAYVTEVWDTNATEKTEYYHAYYNIGNSKITDLEVRDESREYTLIDWDINGSLSSKAYHYGYNYAEGGVELCFGKSSYGHHRYTLTYKINGFVYNTEDGKQMIYWTLLNKINPAPAKVTIIVRADEKFSRELPVWGYGNLGGLAFVGDDTILEDIDNQDHDGEIVLYNNNLSNTDYMTLLAEFDEPIFNTEYTFNKTMDEVKDMAKEGSTAYSDKASKWDIIVGYIVAFFNIAVWFAIFGAIFASAKKNDNKCGSKMLNFGEKGKKLPKDDFMFHELPCGKDIYRAYWLATNYKLIKKPTDFLGAILLKWTKQGKVVVESETKGKIFKKEETKIHMQENVKLDNDVEDSLYKYMYRASKDGILESHEFESWCKSNYSTILGWFDKALDYENDILINEGKLVPQEVTRVKIFKSTEYLVDESLYEQANYMRGLKNFFNDLGNMKDKEVIEVNLWEEYLMYAQIFGIAEKVAKQFKEMYPNVITDESYNNMIYINSIAYTGMHSASAARSRAQSYSSGGGGFSSGGGGFGSFGGGGGGFGGGSR